MFYCPSADYIHNPNFQELPIVDEDFNFSDQRLYPDLRNNRRQTNKTQKMTRNDSRLVLKIQLKNPLYKNTDFEIGDTHKVNIYIFSEIAVLNNEKTIH